MPTAKSLLKTLAAAVLLCALAARGAGEQGGPNLVRYPGFEDGAAPWHLPEGFDVVPGAGRGGGACLHFVRTDASTYRLATQPIALRPGRRYLFSAWIKTKGVAGDESGATICMEWSGAKGWIGGTYPDGRKGDNDWFRVTDVTPPIPPDATSVGVTLYLRKGMTGEAWFDDIEVHEFSGRPMEAYLAQPAYRGLIFEGEPRPAIRVRVDLADLIEGHPFRPEGGYEGLPGLSLACRLYSGDKVVAEKQLGEPKRRTLDVELESAHLGPGDYRVEVALSQGGRELAVQRLDGTVLAADRRPRVYIDGHGRTFVDGKPFFPLGFYLDTVREEDVKTMAQAGFNCVMPYGFSSMPLDEAARLLEVARRHGVYVIYSVKDLYPGTAGFPRGGVDGRKDADAMVAAAVERFRSHPNLLAWYLNDELPATMRDALETRYRQVRRLDPDHPTWAVLFQVDQLADYRQTCDVFGSDPYPVPGKPLTMAADWAVKTRQAAGGACAFWQVPQVFDWANYRKGDEAAKCRAPTYDEMRVMVYLALTSGARGLICYSYFDLRRDRVGLERRWADVSRIGEEVRSLAPALLATDPVPADLRVSGPHWTARRDGRRLWVLVANPEGRAAAVHFALPASADNVRTLAGRTVPAKDGGVTEDLPPLGCETYVIDLR